MLAKAGLGKHCLNLFYASKYRIILLLLYWRANVLIPYFTPYFTESDFSPLQSPLLSQHSWLLKACKPKA